MAKCPEKIKEQAYCAMLRPHLEYASTAWDPLLKEDITQLEAVQRRAARFVKNEYSRAPGTVTTIYRDLKWRSLEERRKMARLALFHKILNQNVYVRLPPYIYINPRNTPSSARSRLTSISATCNVYKYSFMPRTITEWNSLPVAVTSQKNTEMFKTQLLPLI